MPTFRPPATRETLRTLPNQPDTFWARIRRPLVGSTVLKVGETYRTVDVPTQDEVAEATAVYQGGHIYEVSEEEAEALTAAGYGDGVSES